MSNSIVQNKKVGKNKKTQKEKKYRKNLIQVNHTYKQEDIENSKRSMNLGTSLKDLLLGAL